MVHVAQLDHLDHSFGWAVIAGYELDRFMEGGIG
jgi:hypothetical protein